MSIEMQIRPRTAIFLAFTVVLSYLGMFLINFQNLQQSLAGQQRMVMIMLVTFCLILVSFMIGEAFETPRRTSNYNFAILINRKGEFKRIVRRSYEWKSPFDRIMEFHTAESVSLDFPLVPNDNMLEFLQAEVGGAYDQGYPEFFIKYGASYRLSYKIRQILGKEAKMFTVQKKELRTDQGFLEQRSLLLKELNVILREHKIPLKLNYISLKSISLRQPKTA